MSLTPRPRHDKCGPASDSTSSLTATCTTCSFVEESYQCGQADYDKRASTDPDVRGRGCPSGFGSPPPLSSQCGVNFSFNSNLLKKMGKGPGGRGPHGGPKGLGQDAKCAKLRRPKTGVGRDPVDVIVEQGLPPQPGPSCK